jgi:PTS system nitrogen regulatory IIA component
MAHPQHQNPQPPSTHIELTPPRIAIGVAATSQKRLLQWLSEALAGTDANGEHLSWDELLKGFVDRERLGSTAIGGGFAIPHARFSKPIEPRGVLAILQQPIDLHAHDGQLTTAVLGLAVSDDKSEEHLHILEEAAAIASDPTAMHILLTTRNKEVLFQWLQKKFPNLAKTLQ